MRLKVFLMTCVCTLFLFQTVAGGCQASTSLGGRVTDPAGASIPGASVTLRLTSTSAERKTVSDPKGEYAFSQLMPGRYELTVAHPGFGTSKKTAIDLLVSLPATIDVSLPVATVSSEVTVTAAAQPVLNTTDATLGNAFSGQQIADLPSEARNVPDLLSLQPGVTFLGRTDKDTGNQSNGNTSTDSRSGSTNGGRSDQSNITLDGIDVNDINNGYAFTSVLRVSQDAIAEFRVTTSNPNAQEGRSSGAQVALVTKSGTNTLHGAIYEYNRNNLFHANDFFNKQTQAAEGLPNVPLKLIRNVFGVSVGGPIRQNTLFFFANYEGRRDTQGFTSNSDIVPTASFRAGNLQYLCAQGPNCPSNGVFTLSPANLKSLDPQGLGPSSAVLALMNQYPLPNNPTQGDGLNTQGYSFSYNTQRSYNAYTSRIDWNITRSGKQSLFWRGNLQNDSEPGGPQFPGQPGSNKLLTNSKGFASGYTLLLSENLVNNLAFGLTRQGAANAGLLAGPYVTLQGLTPLQATTSSTSTIAPIYNLADNLSWTKHSHNLSFGTNIRFIDDRSSSNALSYSNATGTYQYLNPGTIAGSGGAFDPATNPSFAPVSSDGRTPYNSAVMTLAGIINVGNVTYNNTKSGTALPVGTPVARDYRWNEYEIYAQDTWKALTNLTITYGARYSYLQVPAETSGTQVGVCLLAGNGCSQGAFSLGDYVNHTSQLAASGQAASGAGELGFPLNGRYNGKPDYWTPEKGNLGPRIAFAYSPTPDGGVLQKLFGSGKSSIRAGYSLVFDHFGAAVVQNFDTQGSFGLATTLQTSAGLLKAGTAPRFTGVNSVPQGLLPPAPTVGFPGIPARSGPTSGAIYWSEDSGIKTPYAHMVDFSIARELRSGSSFEVTYVGRFSHRLLEQEDVAMPTNLSAAGTTYFAAARQMSLLARSNGGNGVDVSTVAPVPYWQQLFGGLNGQDIGFGTGYTATQNIYLLYQQNIYNEANALYALDMPDSTTGAGINPNQAYPSNRFYHDQFSALYAYRSIGASNYNALEAVYRQHIGLGLQADFNYTFSKSLDTTSQAERLGSSGSVNGAQIFNTWNPSQLYGNSDFDLRHQVNANYIWELPIGRGKRFASSIGKWADELIGGWQTTGIVRWTSGFPFSVNNGNNFPTNYDIQGFATQVSKVSTSRGKLQQQFADPAKVFASFDFALPGESGSRNVLRGDGYFDEDAGLSKSFPINERMRIRAGVEVFNVTNTVRFDAQSVSARLDNANGFGNATSALTNPRLAQFHARFEF